MPMNEEGWFTEVCEEAGTAFSLRTGEKLHDERSAYQRIEVFLTTEFGNLLVLDEPTNDLDIETLDLLQELLSDFDGTTLIVSHDRDFIDRIAMTTIAMEGDGKALVYAGGWSDYQAQKTLSDEDADPSAKPQPAAKQPSAKDAQKTDRTDGAPTKLSYKDQRRLDALPKEIARLEAEIAKLEEFLATPNLYEEHPRKFDQAVALHKEKRDALDASESEWLELEERREALEN